MEQAQGIPATRSPRKSRTLASYLCNPIGQGLLSNIVSQGMIPWFPRRPLRQLRRGIQLRHVPVRSLNETKFDIRLDQTFTDKDTAFARFSYDQAFSYDPGGAPPPSLAEANPFGSNETLINHARNIGIGETHVFSPRTLNQAALGLRPHLRLHCLAGYFTCGSATLGGVGIPNADLGCSDRLVPQSLAVHTVRVWFPSLWLAAIGLSAIAATRPFRAGRTSSPSGIRST